VVLRSLVRSGELPAIKIGGRGQWRVDTAVLDSYIDRMYATTKNFVAAHPYALASRAPAATPTVATDYPAS